MNKELEKLVKILQDKKQTAISAEGNWLVIKFTCTPQAKKIFEKILWEPLGVREPWYKLDYGEYCKECLNTAVFDGQEYCFACMKERRKVQNKEAKRRQRQRDKGVVGCQH